jgi:two-component system, LytTR family, sensor kinase
MIEHINMDDKTPFRRKLVRCAKIFGCWLLVGLFFASQDFLRRGVTGKPIEWGYILKAWLGIVCFWTVVTPVILWIGRRFPLRQGFWLRSLPVHFLFSVLVALTELFYFVLLNPLIGSPAEDGGVFSRLTYTFAVDFQFNLLTYWALLGLALAFNYYVGYREKELKAAQLELNESELKSQLANAQLSALKMQLHPHFLFNTLNAVVVLVRKGRNQSAVDMLTGLSELLRYTLESIGAQEVRLEQEIQFIEQYLEIEKVRFKDRLRVEMRIDKAALGAFVPNLILQPLVENALRHGVGRRSTAGLIEISARRENGMLNVQVRDDGPGLGINPPGAGGNGIGVTNTRMRLRQLYGEEQIFDLRTAEYGGAVATIIIPYRLPNGSSAQKFETQE